MHHCDKIELLYFFGNVFLIFLLIDYQSNVLINDLEYQRMLKILKKGSLGMLKKGC